MGDADPARRRPSTLERWGRASWLALGIIVFAAVVHTGLAAMSGLVVPLVIAVVIGMLAVPLVDRLERHRVPRGVGAGLVMLLIAAIGIGAVAIAVNGMIDQGDEITRQLTAGLTAVGGWLDDLDLDLGDPGERVEQAKDLGSSLLPGLAGWFATVFSSAVSFALGTLMAMFLLFFVLADWARLRDWVAGHLGVPPDLGSDIVDDATGVIREGFMALTVSSVVVSVVIGLTMLALDLPLAFTIALVTFVTSYVPYLGAIFSGVIAFLVALGASGLTDALILLVVILVVQNLVQAVLTTKLTSDRLSLHPIAALGSTLVGAAVAGLLGATLSAPVLALIIQTSRRVRSYSPATDEQDGGEADDRR